MCCPYRSRAPGLGDFDTAISFLPAWGSALVWLWLGQCKLLAEVLFWEGHWLHLQDISCSFSQVPPAPWHEYPSASQQRPGMALALLRAQPPEHLCCSMESSGRLPGGTRVVRGALYEAGLQPKMSDVFRMSCLVLMFLWLITSEQKKPPCQAAKGPLKLSAVIHME